MLAHAGSNQKEIEKAILYFSTNDQETDKLKSLYDLLKNMNLHHVYYSDVKIDNSLKLYFEYADSLYYDLVRDKTLKDMKGAGFDQKLEEVAKRVNSFKSTLQFAESEMESHPEGVPQIQVVTGDFLIEQVNHAFFLKENSHMIKKLSFEDFCEYILPPNIIDTESFRGSGKMFYDFFSKYIGRVSEDNIEEAFWKYNITMTNMRRILADYPVSTRIGFEEFFFQRVPGFDCFSETAFCAMAMSSLGVPTGLTKNYFKSVPGQHSKCYVYSISDTLSLFDPIFRVPEQMDLQKPKEQIGMNYFKLSYNIQKASPWLSRGDSEFVPNELSSRFIADVTSLYLETKTIKINLVEEVENKLCYLATFNRTNGMIAVNWTTIDKSRDEAVFENVIPERLYFPVVYENEAPRIIGKPFILKNDSSLEYFSNGTDQDNTLLDSVIIREKFPHKRILMQYAERLVGTAIMGVKKTGEKDTLYKLDFVPKPYLQDVIFENRTKYDAYEMVLPDKSPKNRFAEVEFLTNRGFGYTNVVTATPLPVLSYADKMNNKENKYVKILANVSDTLSKELNDGNMETSPISMSRYVLNLEHPQKVIGWRFAPVNANNGIVKGNKYRLFFWNREGWVQYGSVQTAMYNYLRFDDLPRNGLFWLKNETTGTEEMPFTIDSKGNQSFIYE